MKKTLVIILLALAVLLLIIFFITHMMSSSVATAHTKPTTTLVPSAKPDLVITKIKVDKSGKAPKITYVVKNRGKATAPVSTTALEVTPANPSEFSTQELTALSKSVKHNVPALAPGQSYTAQVSCPVVTRKKYTVKATADYQEKISESDESNNRNAVRFSIGFGL